MNYTLHQLRIFQKIAETRSVTKAAEALHLTQPAVSIQLRNFQDQFDIPLTEVINQRIYITDFGKEMVLAAESILQEVDKISSRTLAFRNELSGHLKISIVSTAKYIMPFFLTGFMKKHPGVDLTMDVTNKQQVIRSLEHNEVDFSLVSILPKNLRLHKIDLLENKLYLVGNREMSPRGKQPLAKTIFENNPLILRESGSGTRQTMERFLAKQRFAIRKKIELTSNEAVKQAVLAGLGYSIMPLIGIKNELQSGALRIIPVKGLPIQTMWSLIWLKGKRFSPVAQAFLEFLESEKKAVVEKHFRSFNETDPSSVRK